MISQRYIDNFPQTKTTAMVWPRVKDARGQYHQEDVNYIQVQGERRRGRPKKGWLDNIREDMKEYNMTQDTAENSVHGFLR